MLGLRGKKPGELEPPQTWSSASEGGCQVGLGMIWAVTAATPLYHEELELVGARLRGPGLFCTGALEGRRFDSRPTAGMMEPSFSVTFRNPGSVIALPSMFHHTIVSEKRWFALKKHQQVK